jgi:hypothetical protein
MILVVARVLAPLPEEEEVDAKIFKCKVKE